MTYPLPSIAAKSSACWGRTARARPPPSTWCWAYWRPTTGSVEIDGIDISKQRARALARTNFAAVYATLPGNLTVIENLRFFGLLYSIDSLRIRVEELLQEFDLAHLRHTKCGLLSSGEQTRAALAKALLNQTAIAAAR